MSANTNHAPIATANELAIPKLDMIAGLLAITRRTSNHGRYAIAEHITNCE